ncbi:MAG: hypothetical protein P8X73_02110 [Ignavibacteriaceae bacterium]
MPEIGFSVRFRIEKINPRPNLLGKCYIIIGKVNIYEEYENRLIIAFFPSIKTYVIWTTTSLLGFIETE